MQHTLKNDCTIHGVGLHTGQDIVMRMIPAGPDHGIVFVRTDMATGENEIPALWDNVVDTRLCTVIGNDHGASVGTIEHVMAALRGCGVDNLCIEIDGPEVPVMDGSAMPFLRAIEKSGLHKQKQPRRIIKVLRPVSVEKDGKRVSLSPSSQAEFGGEIDFAHPDIGSQVFSTRLLNGNFKHDIADARTFGFASEVEQMRAAGLARGGSLDNAIVLDDDSVLNPEGLRYADEFIRHKLLDAIGDLYLAGGQILGAYDGYKAGHEMNNLLLHELFSDARNWAFVEESDGVASTGLRSLAQPAVREREAQYAINA